MNSTNVDWRFKRVVRESGLTLQDLADLTNINRAYLSLYSNGRLNLTAIEKKRISQALGLPENKVFERGAEC